MHIPRREGLQVAFHEDMMTRGWYKDESAIARSFTFVAQAKSEKCPDSYELRRALDSIYLIAKSKQLRQHGRRFIKYQSYRTASVSG